MTADTGRANLHRVNLALRNRIADWILEALTDPAARAPVVALVSFACGADARGIAPDLGDAELEALQTAEGLFEAANPGVRLREDLATDLEPLRARALRFERALETGRSRCGASPVPRQAKGRFGGEPPGAEEIRWVLCAASALFEEDLFFEVHEILEPAWGRASEPLRSFLQGLIQVAVGLHHHGNGNLRGAVSLLSEGNAKLEPHRPEAWGVELQRFCAEIARLEAEVHQQLATGRQVPLRVPPLVTGAR